MRELVRDPLLDQDAARIAEVVQARGGGATWADSVAGSMERHYSPGRTWEAVVRGFLGLARLGDVLDVASGDGVLAELLASRARSLTCIDFSARVVGAGRRRLQHLSTVRFVQADMHVLPFPAGRFDHALLMNALAYSRDPARVFAELERTLRPGASLVIVSLASHRHRAAVHPFDHRNLGSDPDELRFLLETGGFVVEMCAVTSREKRPPHFEIVTTHARRRED
jgi:ArsR family transcriptional regulator